MNERERIITDYLGDYSLEELLEEFNIDPAEAFIALLDGEYISNDEFIDWLGEDNLDFEEDE